MRTWLLGVFVLFIYLCVWGGGGGKGGNPMSDLVLVKVGLDKEALFTDDYLKQTT